MTDTRVQVEAAIDAGPRSTRAARRRLLQISLLAPAVLLVAACVVAPTLMALVDSLKNAGQWTLTNYATFATRAPYPQVLTNTLVIAGLVTVITVVMTAPLSAFLATRDNRAAAIVLGLIAASMWISILVKIYAWQVVLARLGPLNYLLASAGLASEPVPFLYTRGAVVLSMVQFLVPYAAMMMYAGMKRVDWDLIIASRTLGARTWTVFRQVYWPQVRFSVVTAGLVVFMVATSFYVAPALLGGPREVMVGMQMHSDLVNRYDSGMAATTGVVLTALLLTVAWVTLRLAGVSFARAADELAA